MSRKEKVEKLTKKLEEGILDVLKEGQFKSYLKTLNRFKNYSANNVILILSQCKNASLVAGFKAWNNDFNRKIKQGEKAIQILGFHSFNPKKDFKKDEKGNYVLDENGDKIPLVGGYFVPVSVYDVSQTEGDELPKIMQGIKGDIEDMDDLFYEIKQQSTFPIEFVDIPNNKKSRFNKDRIEIQQGLDELESIKLVIHEIVQQKLTTENAIQKEIETEAISFMICDHFDINTDDYSFEKIASLNQDIDTIKKSLKTIKETACFFIEQYS